MIIFNDLDCCGGVSGGGGGGGSVDSVGGGGVGGVDGDVMCIYSTCFEFRFVILFE